MDELPEILNGISVSNLQSTTGVKFDVTNIQDAFSECDIEGYSELLSTESEEVLRKRNLDPICGYPKEPFSVLWSTFKRVKETDLVRKKVISEGNEIRPTIDSTVKILYSVYVEGCDTPIGQNKSNSHFNCCLNNSGMLPGILLAILSMTEGERSQFLVHHSFMYGELGCPPIIPKAATCLLHIVLSTIVTADKENGEEIREDILTLPQFEKALNRAKFFNKEAVKHFKNNNYNQTLHFLQKSLKLMIECRLADDKEENEQKQFLCEQYIKMGVCYNKLNQPYKTCMMFNDYHKICNIYNNWKALFTNGKALVMIGNFKEADKKLKIALKLQPGHKEIEKELDILSKKMSSTNDYEKKLLNILSSISKGERNTDTLVNGFVEEIENIFEFLKMDDAIASYRFELPPGLTKIEMDCIKEKTIEKGFSFTLGKDAGKEYIDIKKTV